MSAGHTSRPVRDKEETRIRPRARPYFSLTRRRPTGYLRPAGVTSPALCFFTIYKIFGRPDGRLHSCVQSYYGLEPPRLNAPPRCAAPLPIRFRANRWQGPALA